MPTGADPTSEEAAPSEQRRVVLHPRTAAARRVRRLQNAGARTRGSTVDDAEVLEFMRRQRNSALQVFVPVVCAVGLALATVALFPSVGAWKVGDIPALWLVLGPIALFGMLAATAFNERRALRLERQWIDEHR